MKRVFRVIISLCICLSLFACGISSGANDVSTASEVKPYVFTFEAFDTQCAVSLYGLPDDAKAYIYSVDIYNLVNSYENVFSKTRTNSEIYEINHRTTDSVMISNEVANLFTIAKDMNEWSGYRFDISSGTLIDLWDVKNRKTVPTLEEINNARRHCENYKYEIERDVVSGVARCNRITFTGDKNTQYDFGALIKGYCCDGIRAMLDENDEITACIINLGGNVMCYGEVSERKGGAFNVGIFKPFSGSEIIDKVSVKNRNVITSGNYQRYFKVEGDDRVYHHIIDPVTGYPTDNGLDSVTIVSENGLLGDYLSTACMLVGEASSKELIDYASKSFNDKNLQAIFVHSDGSVTKYPKKVKLV